MLLGRSRRGFDVAPGGSRLVDAPTAAASGQLVRFPPHLYPPRGSTPIFKSAEANLLGVIGDVQQPADLQFQLGKGRAGVLVVVSPFIDSPTATSDVSWRILVNGQPPAGLSELTIIGRAAASIEKVFDKWSIELPEAANVSVSIINNDGVAKRVGLQLEGWDYPSALVYV